jgi:threonine aldolase
VAQLFGHEAALFAPTGSMANQICIQLLVPRAEELLCDSDAHVLVHEIGAAAAVGGVSTRTWTTTGADIDPELVADMIRPDTGYQTVPTRAVAVEQTHNRGGGGVIPLSTLEQLRASVDQAGISMHCDGARIWHAHVADGVPLSVYGGLFDTLSVCLSKGLGAPVGSLVVSTAERIQRARVIRKRMGGGMRQAGILAAAGRYALAHHIDRLGEDHARARRLAEALAPFGVVDAERVRTNIVILNLAKSTVDTVTLVKAARDSGVLVSQVGPHTVRLVTHLDVDDDGIDTAIGVLSAILRG